MTPMIYSVSSSCANSSGKEERDRGLVETSASEGSREGDCPSSYYQHQPSLSLREDQISYCHDVFRDQAIFRLVPVRMIGSNGSLRNQSRFHDWLERTQLSLRIAQSANSS